MLPLKKKNEAWKKDCMDVLEAIGRNQYYSSAGLIENYEMVRGRFIYSHYLDREDYADVVDQLSREFDIPSHLRHYDIISQVINTLSGEYQKRPDIFRVKANDEGAINNYVTKKTELLMEYLKEQLDNSINERLMAQGLDPNDTENPQVQQARQAMTPPEIERYMKTSWMDAAEIWGEHQLLYDKQRFNLPEKEKVEFEDMLVADRCFRHFYLTADGYSQETWNPVNTFYHKSPEVNHIEKGDYVGRVFFLTVPEIINRYGHLMTNDELMMLEESKRESYSAKDSVGETTYSGLTPNTIVPSWNFPEQHFTVNTLGFDPNNPEIIDMNIMSALGNKSAVGDYNRRAFFQVTEAYWMSQRKLGKFVYPDPEAPKGKSVMLVDETFDKRLFPGIKELDNSFMELGDDEQVNTITWTWVNQVWKGIKINNRFTAIKEPIYLDIKPNEFQFKGDQNIYGAKLPVCGQIFNNRNAESMSLVDLMKPHQIGHNVAMNQLYEIAQREIGRFALMDLNLLPSSKDWGGERNYEKFMMVARQLGGAPIDSSPSNKAGDHQSFRVIDLDESARMISRTKIAEFFELQALKQVGITPQRLGATQASESATGVEQAVNQSFAQTESHFTNFSNYKRRCLQMNLEIAQYVQSRKEVVEFMYTMSDLSRAFIKLSGTDLLLSEFGIFVQDSQEVQRQLNMLRQLFMENNTVGATPPDLATVIMSNSPAEIKAQLKASWEKTQQMQQQQQTAEQQAQQAALQQQAQMAEAQRQFEADQNELDRANERYIAEVKAMGTATINNSPDMDANGVPDVLEIEKFNLEKDRHSDEMLSRRLDQINDMKRDNRKMDLESQRIKLEKDKMAHTTEENEKDRELKRQEMQSKEKIARSKPKPKSK